MKRYIYFILIIFFCFTCAPMVHLKTEELIINEGRGVSNFKIGTITKDSVIKFFGRKYKTKNYNNYSYEMLYQKMGLSFYYFLYKDKYKIFAIACNRNFKGLTSKGFNINKMLVNDMIHIYGKPRWEYLEAPVAHYDSLGIYFVVKSREIPAYYNNFSIADSLADEGLKNYFDNLDIHDTIIEITIGIPGTEY